MTPGRDWFYRLPLMLTTLLLLVWGGAEYGERGSDAAAPMLVSGLILMGMWAAQEMIMFADRRHRDDDESGEDTAAPDTVRTDDDR